MMNTRFFEIPTVGNKMVFIAYYSQIGENFITKN